tara:strand:- start:41 stop:844 length:804 start_codon:yes stop_codon:yes gene_type:complete
MNIYIRRQIPDRTLFIRYKNIGKNGKPNTKTKCIVLCDSCQGEFNRCYSTRVRHLNDPGINGDYCQGCIQKLPAKREKMSKAIREMMARDPEWVIRKSLSTKGRINLGNKNGMKKRAAQKKVSNARKEMFKDPKKRQELSERVSKAWADGKYDGVKVGRCKWFDFKKSDGSIVKCQGKWEFAYAKWLDSNDIAFLAHRGRIKYIQNGVKRSYYPDFYLIDDDVYIDIKNKYHFSLNKEKFKLIQSQNPKISIILLFKEDLKKLGVKL